eukprot:scaffold39524_cov78-Phaeocystis_antarctica.AAC.6
MRNVKSVHAAGGARLHSRIGASSRRASSRDCHDIIKGKVRPWLGQPRPGDSPKVTQEPRPVASQLAGELGRLDLLLLGDVLTAGDVAPTLPGGVALTGQLLPPHVAAAFPPLGRVLARRLAHAVERELAVLVDELVVVLSESRCHVVRVVLGRKPLHAGRGRGRGRASVSVVHIGV